MMLQKVGYFIAILLSLHTASLEVFAQIPKGTLYNDGVMLALEENSVLYVGTDYIQRSGIIQNKGTIALAANWTNNSTKEIFKDNTGTVKLVGTNQVLGGSEATQFNNLVLDGEGTKILENNQEVTGTLDLDESELSTGVYIMYLKNASQNSLLRRSGFISSSKGGGVRRNTSLSMDYLFPLGFRKENRLYYRPIVVKSATPTDNSYTAAIYPDINTIEGLNQNLTIGGLNELEAVNQDYYFRLSREKGNDPVMLGVYYESTIDGDYNTLLQWKKDDLKLERIATVQETQSGSLTGKLSVRQWNNFNDEYYLMARTPVKTPEDTFTMEIPNVISVNNDGKNDTWQIPSFNGFVENEVYVYNRWGSEVYRKTNYSNQDAWAAENINPGTYFYRIIINPKSANPEVKHGYITILK